MTRLLAALAPEAALALVALGGWVAYRILS